MADLNVNASASSEVGGLRKDSSGNITHGKVGNRWVPIETYNQIASGQGGNIDYSTSVGQVPTVTDFGSSVAIPMDMFNQTVFQNEGLSLDERLRREEAGITSNEPTVSEIFDNTQNDFAFAPPDLERARKGLTDLGIDISNMSQTQIVGEYDNFLNSDDPRARTARNQMALGTDVALNEGVDLLADDTFDTAKAFDAGSKPPAAPEKTFLQKMFGDKDSTGFFEPVVGGALGVGRLALGFKQFEQAGEALDFQKDAFERNFAMQTEMINRRLGDRERARQLLQGNTKGADDAARRYVDKYGVKDKK
jgi:hypothetical protein